MKRYELTSDTLDAFKDRFVVGHDCVLLNTNIIANGPPRWGLDFKILVRSYEKISGSPKPEYKWVALMFELEHVIDFDLIKHNNYDFIVMGDPINIWFENNAIHLNLFSGIPDPVSLKDLKSMRSENPKVFLISAKKGFWYKSRHKFW
jgi:hypothetical protein